MSVIAEGVALPPAASNPRRPVLDVQQVVKTYGVGETAVHALRGVDLRVDAGEYVAVMGASGLGQVDADERARLPRRAERRHATCSTGSTCRTLDDRAAGAACATGASGSCSSRSTSSRG